MAVNLVILIDSKNEILNGVKSRLLNIALVKGNITFGSGIADGSFGSSTPNGDKNLINISWGEPVSGSIKTDNNYVNPMSWIVKRYGEYNKIALLGSLAGGYYSVNGIYDFGSNQSNAKLSSVVIDEITITIT